MKKLLLALGFLASPAIAADLPPPDANQAQLTVPAKPRVIRNEIPKVILSKPKGPVVVKAKVAPKKPPVELVSVSKAPANEAKMSLGKDKLIISCSDACSATRIKDGKTETIALGAGGEKEFIKHVAAAKAYGWR
jgi:hypothetical protein